MGIIGWYALYKWFRPWRKVPYVDYVRWYNDLLELQWLATLTPEQRKRYEEKKERERKEALFPLLFMKAFVDAYGEYRM